MMTPEQERQANCPHPREYLRRAESWGPFGAWLRAVRCHLCGATR